MIKQIYSGFSLIELMIVISIIGILAAIAYPSYQNSVQKSRRVEAKSILLEAAARQEKFFSQSYEYASTMAVDAKGLGYSANPFITDSGFFSVAVVATPVAKPTSFTITATAQGAQVSDSCDGFSITNTGVRAVTEGTNASCW